MGENSWFLKKIIEMRADFARFWIRIFRGGKESKGGSG